MSGITWLHLSDWHQKGEEFDRRVVLKGLLNDIKKRERISSALKRIDFIFFTGDLAYHGTAKEYRKAKEVFLDPLLEAAKIGKSWHERLFIVPGNHDLDRKAFETQRDDLLKIMRDPENVADWLTDDRKRRNLLDPLADYNEFIHGYLGTHQSFIELQPVYSFVKKLEVSGKKVAILCINSSWLSGRYKDNNGNFNDYGHLRVGEPQLLDTLEQVEDANLVIAVMHHPFEWLDMPDRELVPGYLCKLCHFILFGHQHLAKVKIETSTEGNFIAIPAGACYDRRGFANGYNFVHLDTDSGQGTVYLRRWNRRHNCWAADTDAVVGGKFDFSTPKVRFEPLQVAVAVIVKDKKALLVRRKEKEGTLWWQFPGGVIRPNQKDNKVAEREAFNETDIVCKTKKKLGHRIHPDTHVVVHYWLCEYVKGEPIVKDTKDLDKAQWINIKKALELISSNIYEPVKKLLEKSL